LRALGVLLLAAAVIPEAAISAPNTSITSKPASVTNLTSATFRFTSNVKGATFECQLDMSAYAVCTSPKTYSGLVAGSHTFRVRAKAAGVVDATPAAYNWVIDLTPPNTVVNSAPFYPTSWTNAAFTFSSTEGGSKLQCRIDGGAWAACTSPIEYFQLVVGSHLFAVRATDVAGNVDPTPASYSWPISPPPSGLSAGLVRPFAVQHMGGSGAVTREQALIDAEHFDLMTALYTTYSWYFAEMKTVNTALTLYAYMNGTFTYRTDLVESAYCHDQNGNRIEPLQFPGTYMLNPSSADALAFQKQRASNLLFYSSYTGLYIDVTGTGPLLLSYVEALCINPATGQVWTTADWLASVQGLVEEIRRTVAPRPVILNSLKDGIRYWDPTAPTRTSLMPGITGSIAETSLRETGAPITSYPTEANWKKHVDMLMDAGARGYSIFQMTKTWVAATEAQKAAWHEFALASYLLGNDGRAWFTFSYVSGDSTVDRPLNHLDLGPAAGAYVKIGGVYQRSFQRGRVLVNAGTTTITVSLGTTYHTLAGAAVTSITLPPKSAEILRNP
jgi:hypothetical protein